MTTPKEGQPFMNEVLPHHVEPELPHTFLSTWINRILVGFANKLSWLWVLLILVILVNVFMKNVMGQGRVEFEEIQWHIFSLVFMLGLASVMATDDHVRIDLFHESFSLKTKAWVDLLGTLLLFIPFIALIGWFSIPFVIDSYANMETSNAPAGLPYRWAIKSVLMIAMGMLLLAALAHLSRIVAYLFMGKPAVVPGTEE